MRKTIKLPRIESFGLIRRKSGYINEMELKLGMIRIVIVLLMLVGATPQALCFDTSEHGFYDEESFTLPPSLSDHTGYFIRDDNYDMYSSPIADIHQSFNTDHQTTPCQYLWQRTLLERLNLSYIVRNQTYSLVLDIESIQDDPTCGPQVIHMMYHRNVANEGFLRQVLEQPEDNVLELWRGSTLNRIDIYDWTVDIAETPVGLRLPDISIIPHQICDPSYFTYPCITPALPTTEVIERIPVGISFSVTTYIPNKLLINMELHHTLPGGMIWKAKWGPSIEEPWPLGTTLTPSDNINGAPDITLFEADVTNPYLNDLKVVGNYSNGFASFIMVKQLGSVKIAEFETPSIKFSGNRSVNISVEMPCAPAGGTIIIYEFGKEDTPGKTVELVQIDDGLNDKNVKLHSLVKNLTPAALYQGRVHLNCLVNIGNKLFDVTIQKLMVFNFTTPDSYPDPVTNVIIDNQQASWEAGNYSGLDVTHQILECFDESCEVESLSWEDVCATVKCTLDVRNKPKLHKFMLRAKNAHGFSEPTQWLLRTHANRSRWIVGTITFMACMFSANVVLIWLATRCCRSLQRKRRNFGISETGETTIKMNPIYKNNNHHDGFGGMGSNSLSLVKINSIKQKEQIGEGISSKVFRGVLIRPQGNIDVALKQIGVSESEEFSPFLHEAMVIQKISHSSIVKLYGVCLDQGCRFLVLEYMNQGDLLGYLRRREAEGLSMSLFLATGLTIAIQLAEGCVHIVKNHCIHRDLAARNCLVTICDGKLHAKIGDFGLATSRYEDAYSSRAGSQRFHPVRWMSPEALTNGQFSTASDVWSFGVLLWEIFSFGQKPYKSLECSHVCDFILNDGRLPPIKDAPECLYGLMTECWAKFPDDRLSFSAILEKLKNVENEQFGEDAICVSSEN